MPEVVGLQDSLLFWVGDISAVMLQQIALGNGNPALSRGGAVLLHQKVCHELERQVGTKDGYHPSLPVVNGL